MTPDQRYMRLALRLAQRAYGRTSPNPMVGAVLVKRGAIIGQGWHHRAGEPHAEIEALHDAARRGHDVRGATLYVTLEPCCTHGRTPPCAPAIIEAGIQRVVVGATDPNPAHNGRGLRLLADAGVEVAAGVLAEPAARLNEAFNHWIVHRTPFVIVKAAMTLDGKIATPTGESQWITGEKARAWGMKLRAGADAILVGVKTVLRDNPRLTVRSQNSQLSPAHAAWAGLNSQLQKRRFILDSRARTPLSSHVVSDEFADLTTLVVTPAAPPARVKALAKRVRVWEAPEKAGRVDPAWLLQTMGREGITSLLVEGGGEVNAAFLLGGLAHRVAFFYAPKILGGRAAVKAVAGEGVRRLAQAPRLRELQWRRLGPDLFLSARLDYESLRK
jgi:diaminohydroxyphosphoribosylaminopyrimidine deaminase/5-amino-6-(5-phosphoribosylamino)uracil reductase